MSTDRPKIIFRPTDTRRVRQLVAKLDQYYRRLPAELRDWGDVDTAVKILLLDSLLVSARGMIDTERLYRQIHRDQPELWALLESRPVVYLNACVTIDDYCRTGGQNVTGGSLPDLP